MPEKENAMYHLTRKRKRHIILSKVYFIFPLGQTMPTAAEPRGRDDRISLLKSQHRPYGNNGGGVHLYGQDTVPQQFGQKQIPRHSSLSQTHTEKIFCLKQQFLLGATIVIVSSLVVFVLFIATFR